MDGFLCFPSLQQQQQQQHEASGLSTWNNNNRNNNNNCSFFGGQGQGQDRGNIIGRVTPTLADTKTDNIVTTQQSTSATGGLENELGDALDDAFLAKEMNELTFEERQNVLEEVHGVATTIEDSSSSDFDLTTILQEFDKALSKIPKRKRKAYDRALFLRPTLEYDIKYKLMFLRSTGFDPIKASTKLVNHFEFKSTIFLSSSFDDEQQQGDESLLAKDITYDDIRLESQKFSNFFGSSSIFLPRKDQVGRPVLFTNLNNVNWDEQIFNLFENDTGYLRFMWYYFWSIICDDEEAQKQGICRIAYSPSVTPNEDNNNKNDDNNKDRNPFSPFSSSSSSSGVSNNNNTFYARNFSLIARMLMRGRQLIESLPIRFSSYHFCNANPGINSALNLIRLCFGKEMRIRMRAHTGSPLEMQYLVQSFGIDCHDLMVGGSTSLQQHQKIMEEYLQKRRQIEKQQQQSIEQSSEETQMVLCPKKHDVLIGRGSPHQDYIGNKLLLRLVIEPQLPKYMQQSDQFWKTCISMDAVQTIQQQYGGRYLQRSTTLTSSSKKKKTTTAATKNNNKKESPTTSTTTTSSSGWIILDDVTARDKTSAMFRYKARAYKKAAAANANASSATVAALPLTAATAAAATIVPPADALSGLLVNEGSLSIESTAVVMMTKKHPHDSIMTTTNDNNNGAAAAAGGTAAKRLRV